MLQVSKVSQKNKKESKAKYINMCVHSLHVIYHFRKRRKIEQKRLSGEWIMVVDTSLQVLLFTIQTNASKISSFSYFCIEELLREK